MIKPTKYCCELMDQFIEDYRVPIEYDPIFREYYMPLIKNKMVIQGIRYCPWCGTKLPESVRKYYYNILENEYKFDPTLEIEKKENFPEEFKSDKWWKKRNL